MDGVDRQTDRPSAVSHPEKASLGPRTTPAPEETETFQPSRMCPPAQVWTHWVPILPHELWDQTVSKFPPNG